MTMGASVVHSASAISGALSLNGVCTSTVLSTEERTSKMNEDVAVSFVKKSMEGILVRSRKLEVGSLESRRCRLMTTVYFLLSTDY